MRHSVTIFLFAIVLAITVQVEAIAGLYVTFSVGGSTVRIDDDDDSPIINPDMGAVVTAEGDDDLGDTGFLSADITFDLDPFTSGVQGYKVSFDAFSNSPGDVTGRLHEFVTTVERTTGTALDLVINLYSDGFNAPGSSGSLMTLTNHLESVEFFGTSGSVSYQSATDNAATDPVSTSTDANDLVTSTDFIRGSTYELIGTTTVSLASKGTVFIEANTVATATVPEVGSLIAWMICAGTIGLVICCKRRFSLARSQEKVNFK
jgi:hypothetical protein